MMGIPIYELGKMLLFSQIEHGDVQIFLEKDHGEIRKYQHHEYRRLFGKAFCEEE